VNALNTDLNWLHVHTRLLARAIEWDISGRDNSFVLRSSDLRTAEEWQSKAADKEPMLTLLQKEYHLAGEAFERCRIRRWQDIAGVLAVLSVITAGLGLWGLAADQGSRVPSQHRLDSSTTCASLGAAGAPARHLAPSQCGGATKGAGHSQG